MPTCIIPATNRTYPYVFEFVSQCISFLLVCSDFDVNSKRHCAIAKQLTQIFGTDIIFTLPLCKVNADSKGDKPAEQMKSVLFGHIYFLCTCIITKTKIFPNQEDTGSLDIKFCSTLGVPL